MQIILSVEKIDEEDMKPRLRTGDDTEKLNKR